MIERRVHPRRRVWFPVQVDTDTKKDRVAITLDASATGLLLGTRSRLSVGNWLKLTLHPLSRRGERPSVDAEVVWATEDYGPTGDLWPRRVAVRFAEPRPDLEGLFVSEQAHQPAWLDHS